MDKSRLVHFFKQTAALLSVGEFQPQHAADAMSLAQFYVFMAAQIEKDNQDAAQPAGTTESN